MKGIAGHDITSVNRIIFSFTTYRQYPRKWKGRTEHGNGRKRRQGDGRTGKREGRKGQKGRGEQNNICIFVCTWGPEKTQTVGRTHATETEIHHHRTM